MGNILKNIKHAKYTAKEVMIHLQKNGKFRTKQYSAYLKMQYHMASETYSMLSTTKQNLPSDLLYPDDKECAMPVHLTISEVSIMCYTYNEICYLTEAWHFYQKERMKKSYDDFVLDSSTKEDKNSGLKINDLNQFSKHTRATYKNISNNTKKNPLQAKAQTQTITTPSSGLTKQNQLSSNSGKSIPLRIQVLKWAQEGRLILN